MRLQPGCLLISSFLCFFAFLVTIVDYIDELRRSASAKQYLHRRFMPGSGSIQSFQIRRERETSFANMAFLRLGCAVMLLFYIETSCAIRASDVSEVECKEKLTVTAAMQHFRNEAPAIFEPPDPAPSTLNP